MSNNLIGTTAGARAPNAEWFTNDLIPKVPAGESQLWKIHFSIDTDSIVQYTLNSGTNWTSFATNSTHKANSGYEYQLIIEGSDQVNFRATSAVTITFMRIVT